MLVVVAERFSAGGWVTIIVDSAVQPFASVTLTVMVPAPASVTATEEAAGSQGGKRGVDNRGEGIWSVPPAAVKLPAPVVAPLHNRAMLPVEESVSTGRLDDSSLTLSNTSVTAGDGDVV